MSKNTIKVQVSDVEMGDDEDGFVELPAHWVICGTCRGNGAHSLAIGAITQEDREDWSDDEFDTYLSGGYDRTCGTCNGDGKVLEINRDAYMKPAQVAALAKYDKDVQEAWEDDAMHRAEMAAGC